MSAINIEEAIRLLLKEIRPVGETEIVDIADAQGAVLAKDLIASYPQPPFNRSPLDGYALRAEDVMSASKESPVELKVIDKVMAGSYTDKVVSQGTTVRLMTGAPIPEGADCVIRQEDTDYGEDTVKIYQEIQSHDGFCDIGSDYHEGALLMKRGEKITGTSLGVIASAGFREVSVFRKPRVALITTGDELAEPGKMLEKGKIYNSNRYLIRGRLRELGFDPVVWEHVNDDAERVAEAIEKVIPNVDMVITTGGVSVGQKDIMHETGKILNAERLFWGVKLKPGSPIIAYKKANKLIMCLSGNPFGALVTFEMIVRPVLAALALDDSIRMTETHAVCSGSFSKASPGRRIIRARYRDGIVNIPEGGHESGILGSIKDCNCLIDITPGNKGLKSGDKVKVWIL